VNSGDPTVEGIISGTTAPQLYHDVPTAEVSTLPQASSALDTFVNLKYYISKQYPTSLMLKCAYRSRHQSLSLPRTSHRRASFHRCRRLALQSLSGKRTQGGCNGCTPPPDIERCWHDTWFHCKSCQI